MTNLRKAAEMALEALIGLYEMPEFTGTKGVSADRLNRKLSARESIAELRQALAQPEQEPAAWLVQYKDRHEFVWGAKPEFRGGTVIGLEPLYTAPPKHEEKIR